jgi:K+-transporting ATPase ATPase A chain
MWTLPVLIVVVAVVLSIPVGRYMAKMMDVSLQPRGVLRWIEQKLDTGPQDWKQYAIAMMLFTTIGFIVGFAILALQPWLPLNPDGKGMLSPSTIFNTVASFLANTQLQHYSGEVHLSYFSQLFFIVWMDFIGPIIGLASCVAVIRGLRGDKKLGNFYVDMWRGIFYVVLPISLIVAAIFIAGGMPMTLQGNAVATAVETGALGNDPNGHPLPQTIARGPVAAIVAPKQFFADGGGFFGPNSTHPYENPNSWTNFVESVGIIMVPMGVVVMFGSMLRNMRHAMVIYGVMLAMLIPLIWMCVHTDSERPNPGLVAHAAETYQITDATAEGGTREVALPAIADLPVDQSLGNLEGKELRFGTSAGPTWAVLCTSVANGSVNCMHDSLNPLAGLAPMVGMWINCIFGGVGVGLLNMLVYLIVAVFLSGLMVGRTPEYLSKKIEAREMKLAMLALLIHPILILGPTGLFCYLGWSQGAQNNPGTHGFSETLYEFSSASANNGSGFEGLGDTYGLNDNPAAAPFSVHWDIATGLVMLFGRYIPMIVPLAIAGSVAAKKPTPVTTGTLNTNTFTFGCMLLGTVLMLAALLFIPAAVLGPAAEHLGPLPFGG